MSVKGVKKPIEEVWQEKVRQETGFSFYQHGSVLGEGDGRKRRYGKPVEKRGD